MSAAESDHDATVAAHRAAIALCPPRAEVRCPCGRNAVQDAADALEELDAPCPDCGRTEGRQLSRHRPTRPTTTNPPTNPTGASP